MKPASANEFAAGWRVLIGSIAGIGAGVSSLYFYSLGIFIKPLAAEFGWTRGEASLGALIGTAAAAIMSPVIGRMADRFGSLGVATVSLLLAAGFQAHAALISGLASFLIVTGIVSLITVGTSPLPYTRLTVTSFVRNRGLALGIVLSGTGLGAILIPRFLVPYVATEGWRAGYAALGIVALLATPLVAALLWRSPDPARQQQQPRLPLRDLVSNPGFLPLAAMFLLAAVAILGAVVQFVPMLTDAGLSPERAGGIAALIGVAAIAGRLVIGLLLDRLPSALVTAGLFALAALGTTMLALGGVAAAIPGALITGAAVGAEVDLLSFQTARYFPRHAFGQANGLIYALFLAGGAIGPVLSGGLYDLSGDYRLSLLVAAGLLAIAAAIGLRLPAPRSVREEQGWRAPVEV